MKLTDSIKKAAALLGFAAIGTTAMNAQNPRISELAQPQQVSACVGSTTAYLDILPLYQAIDEPNVTYIWYKISPEGNLIDVRYDNDGNNVGGASKDGSRLQFPALEETMAGEYIGMAWIDDNQNGLFDGLEPSWWTNEVVVNVLVEPVIINQTVYVYADEMMMDDPIRMSRTNRNAMVGDGNAVMIDIDAHIFGQFVNTQTQDPDYDIDIQWYTFDGNQQPVALMNNNVYAGVNADQFTVNVSANMIGNVYWAELTGQCGTIKTAEFTLTDVPTVVFNDPVPDQEVCKGAETTVTATATPTGTGETLNYQWWMGTTQLMDGAEFDGVTTETLTIKDGYIQDDIDNLVLRATLQPSGIFADTDPFTIRAAKDPVIVNEDPTPINLTAGDPLNISITADNATSYQWYKNGTPIPGEVSNSFAIAATATDDSGDYYVHAINDCGVEVPSSTVTVTVTSSGLISSVRGMVEGSLSLSPNPATEKAVVRMALESFAKDATVSLHSATGQAIATQSFANTGEIVAEFDVNALNLASGNYFVVINIDGNSVTERLVIAGK